MEVSKVAEVPPEVLGLPVKAFSRKIFRTQWFFSENTDGFSRRQLLTTSFYLRREKDKDF